MVHLNCVVSFKGPGIAQIMTNPNLAKQGMSQALLERNKCGASAMAYKGNLCKMGSN